MSPAKIACFSLPTASSAPKAAPWWRRRVGVSIVACAAGAAAVSSSAAIEVARAWTGEPRPGAEAAHVVGGVIVALFCVAAYGFATRTRGLSNVAVAAAFALLAHGGTLVLEGEMVGALFLGLAPIVAMLSHVAFAPPQPSVLRDPYAGARMVELWLKTSRRRKTARAAAPVVSRIPLGTRASQVTIIDVLATPQSDSSRGSATPRSCASNA